VQRFIPALCALVVLACADEEPKVQTGGELVPFVDLDPAPDVVEVQLVAEPGTHEWLPGKPADVWVFRDGASDAPGTIPGPLLEAKLGDHVIIHFENRLPEGTTVHWHGLRVPNAADGTPASQMIVPPGGTYDYEFDAIDTGTYWYHPHVEADVQVERGLYAPIVIRGDVEPEVHEERVFVLDDVKVEANGALSTVTNALDMMLGRQGNVVLVNGISDLAIESAAGSRERWRFVNVANGRFFNLELPGYTFLVIGWDGGMLPEPYVTETLLLAPGERYEVIVEFSEQAAGELALRTIYYDRGHDIPDTGPVDILAITIDGDAEPLSALPSVWGTVEPIPFDAATPRRALVLREDDSIPNAPVFSINDEAWPDSTPLFGAPGDVEIWEIVNESEMDHPFHLHGMSFQVLDESGTVIERLGWKDTVNVPQEQTVRFAVQFGDEGRWMYHCHILEHAERGMMGELMLEP
jgi:FtsP/CotA-like multicopper oxidase with cupredoxin domain